MSAQSIGESGADLTGPEIGAMAAAQRVATFHKTLLAGGMDADMAAELTREYMASVGRESTDHLVRRTTDLFFRLNAVESRLDALTPSP